MVPLTTSPRAREIFEQALELEDASARLAYVTRECRADDLLRRRVEQLLEANTPAESLLPDSPVVPLPVTLPTEVPGQFIGRYKLLEQIGEGGFGIVFMAEQREPVSRRVALKVIKPGMDSRSVVARFEAERQALAMMDHPSIARILDGGTTETGRPFFVMELVEGVPITEFCETNCLPVENRIQLFIQVCQAVQSAHQKGIIHRDLKPSNVLVTLHGGVPVPKVIDFGVAKAINQRLTEKTLFTQFATMIGTPAYMSPEQAEMSSLDVDTRSDIYSLGVLLYQLLTGTTPFPEERLRSVAYAEMQRILLQEEPERPSRRMGKQPLRAAPPPVDSQSTARRPRTAIDADLDWIVMKCLEKDRQRRYATANALAADIERYLSNEPILARPPSAFYRFQKAVRRNKVAFAAGLAVTVALLGGMAATSWQAVRAHRAEKAQARQTLLAENRLKTTLAFTDRLFRDVAHQLWLVSGTAPVSEALVTNGMAFLQELQGDAGLTAEFRATLAHLYVRLAQSHAWPLGNTTADYEKGFQLATNAVHLLQSVELDNLSAVRVREFARAELVAGHAAGMMFRFEEAILHLRRAQALVTRLTNDSTFASDALTLQAAIPGGAMGILLLRMGRPEEALTNCFLPFLRAMQARGLDESGSDMFGVAHLNGAYSCVGEGLAVLGRYAEAVPHFQEATRLMEVLCRRAPDAAEFACGLPVVRARLAESLLATGDSRGLELLQQANQAASALVKTDGRNAGFQQPEVEVLRLAARGLTHWAAAPGIPPEVRRSRLAEARNYFHRAEQKLGNLTSEQQRRWLSVDFEKARAFLESYERRWGSKEDASVAPAHGPPRPAPP